MARKARTPAPMMETPRAETNDISTSENALARARVDVGGRMMGRLLDNRRSL